MTQHFAGLSGCEISCAKANHLPEPKDQVKQVWAKNQWNTANSINAFKLLREMFTWKNNVCIVTNLPVQLHASHRQCIKTKEGPVIWRGDKCMGCRYCMVSCPFDIPKFEYHSANPKIEKCTMCYERIKDGKFLLVLKTAQQKLSFSGNEETC